MKLLRVRIEMARALGMLLFDEYGEGLIMNALDMAWMEWTNRLGMAWNVIQGRPVAYKLHIRNGSLILSDHTIASHVFVENTAGPEFVLAGALPEAG